MDGERSMEYCNKSSLRRGAGIHIPLWPNRGIHRGDQASFKGDWATPSHPGSEEQDRKPTPLMWDVECGQKIARGSEGMTNRVRGADLHHGDAWQLHPLRPRQDLSLPAPKGSRHQRLLTPSPPQGLGALGRRGGPGLRVDADLGGVGPEEVLELVQINLDEGQCHPVLLVGSRAAGAAGIFQAETYRRERSKNSWRAKVPEASTNFQIPPSIPLIYPHIPPPSIVPEVRPLMGLKGPDDWGGWHVLKKNDKTIVKFFPSLSHICLIFL